MRSPNRPTRSDSEPWWRTGGRLQPDPSPTPGKIPTRTRPPWRPPGRPGAHGELASGASAGSKAGCCTHGHPISALAGVGRGNAELAFGARRAENNAMAPTDVRRGDADLAARLERLRVEKAMADEASEQMASQAQVCLGPSKGKLG